MREKQSKGRASHILAGDLDSRTEEPVRPCARLRSGPSALLRTPSRFLLVTLWRLRDARLPCDSGWSPGRLRGPALAFAPVHPRCSARLRASYLSRCGLDTRPGRFRRDSGHKQPGPARLGLHPSLHSKLPCVSILRASYLSSRQATPGSSLPSINSREAPPPVEMWVILSA